MGSLLASSGGGRVELQQEVGSEGGGASRERGAGPSWSPPGMERLQAAQGAGERCLHGAGSTGGGGRHRKQTRKPKSLSLGTPNERETKQGEEGQWVCRGHRPPRLGLIKEASEQNWCSRVHQGQGPGVPVPGTEGDQCFTLLSPVRQEPQAALEGQELTQDPSGQWAAWEGGRCLGAARVGRRCWWPGSRGGDTVTLVQ